MADEKKKAKSDTDKKVKKPLLTKIAQKIHHGPSKGSSIINSCEPKKGNSTYINCRSPAGRC